MNHDDYEYSGLLQTKLRKIVQLVLHSYGDHLGYHLLGKYYDRWVRSQCNSRIYPEYTEIEEYINKVNFSLFLV